VYILDIVLIFNLGANNMFDFSFTLLIHMSYFSLNYYILIWYLKFWNFYGHWILLCKIISDCPNNRISTQEELRRYRKCGLFNNERETTQAKSWRAKTSIECPYSRNDFKHIRNEYERFSSISFLLTKIVW
jgi:hypothetical protein